jgi:type II secretory pathway component PulK
MRPLIQIRPRGRRAVVLVLVLWLIIVMGVIASSLAFEVQVNSKLALLQKRQFLAHSLAKGAVGLGMTHLQNDLLMDYADNPNQMADSFSDVWAQPERKEKEIEVKMGEGTYQLEVVDEEGKLNLNFMSQRMAKAMLLFYGYEDEDAEMIANAIVDWRDPDDKATGEPGTTENEYYSALLGQQFRKTGPQEAPIYRCPNENFLTVEQMLDVVGIDPVVYYGFDPDSEDAQETKVRNEIAQGRRPVQKRKRGPKMRPMREILTTRGSGRINLNTAPEEVLAILMFAGNNLADVEAAKSAAESISKHRGSGGIGARTPRPDDAMKSMADLGKIPGVNAAALAQLSSAGALGAQLAFRSDTFTVTGIGRVASVQKTVTAIVSRNLDTYNPDDARLASAKSPLGTGPRGGFAGRRARGESIRVGLKKGDDNFVRIPAVRVVQWIE